MQKKFISIVDVLQKYATEYPNEIAIKFLTQKGYDILTYEALNNKIKKVAAILQQDTHSQAARAIILLPSSLDYVVAFLSCLYAGVVAVPIYPPRKNQHAKRVSSIIKDAEAAFVISQQGLESEYVVTKWINMDSLPPVEVGYQEGVIDGDDIAFIQYTSGSTNTPKGVLVSHQNIMSNVEMIAHIFPGGAGHKVCSWLPPYHDMGLIGGILCSLYLKTELILMPPAYFLQSPFRWLEVMSNEGVSMSVAPNFAFDLCTKKMTPEQLKQLNLSKLQCVYNGSEPIQIDVVQRFIDTFACTGFSSSSFYFCYGLAEATLMCTVKQYVPSTAALKVSRSDFELGKINLLTKEENIPFLSVVNCGSVQKDHAIEIVDPNQLTILPDKTIGEIWVSGPSVTKGYWQQAGLTQITFNNTLPERPGRHYLRTNDFGFMYQNDVYITGRINDRLIIRGRNYYAQDLEQSIGESDPAFEFKGTVVFTVEVEGQAELIVLQEIKRDSLRQVEWTVLFNTVRSTLLDVGLIPYSILFLKPYTLPKTSSGKNRRNAARTLYLEEKLSQIARWYREQPRRQKNSFDFKQWLEEWFNQHLQLTLNPRDFENSILDLGINSITAVQLSNDLQQELGRPVEPLALFEQYSINQLMTMFSSREAKDLPSLNTTDRLKKIYFTVNDGVSTNKTIIQGKEYINFSGYNYLGLSGDPLVIEAVISAIRQWGTSVSASRLVSGEKPLHMQLEKSIAALIGAEDCLVLPSGYGTNITVLTHLFNKDDLIIHDALAHNSILQGAQFSGATCLSFPHNDYAYLTDILEKSRSQYKKALIVTEGIFSMDGDIPDIMKLIALKKRFNAYIMVDEAHSMGVLGQTGRGIREYYNIDAADIDIWMGTLSKSFASCGGYIAGTKELIEHFKYSAAGFIYSAGISPANAAAALAAIQIMQQEPDRLLRLRQRHELLLSLLHKYDIPTGLSHCTPIIPIVVESDTVALQLSERLKENHILALPIIYPAVEKNRARVRLFVNCLHTEEQLRFSAEVIKNALTQIASDPMDKIVE